MTKSISDNSSRDPVSGEAMREALVRRGCPVTLEESLRFTQFLRCLAERGVLSPPVILGTAEAEVPARTPGRPYCCRESAHRVEGPPRNAEPASVLGGPDG